MPDKVTLQDVAPRMDEMQELFQERIACLVLKHEKEISELKAMLANLTHLIRSPDTASHSTSAPGDHDSAKTPMLHERGQNITETLSMAGGSSSVAPTNLQLPPASILKQLQPLRDKIHQFCLVGESLGMDIQTFQDMDFSVSRLSHFIWSKEPDSSSLDSNPHHPKKIMKSHLRFKKSRTIEVETMKTTTKTLSMEAGSNSIALNDPPLPTTSSLVKQVQDLRDELNLFCQVARVSPDMDPKLLLNLESSIAVGIKFAEKALKEGQVPDAYCLDSMHPLVEFNKLSINEAETMKMRYLYVSNGHEIYLLDINASSLPTLPIIAALNLIEERHPVSVSLFKLGSDAYIIGGREYDANMRLHGRYDENGCKGTSHKSFQLSIADNVITLSKGAIGNMKRSKISPIVEEINGAIHVFDSTLRQCNPSFDWIFSHEVLREVHRDHRPSSLQWRKISTHKWLMVDFIRYHLVVGPCIYALCGEKALWFDSKEEEWRVYSRNHETWSRDRDLFKTVWDILTLRGEARCVLELGGEEETTRMYVIITVSEDEHDPRDSKPAVAAYLLNSSGKIVCTQPLNHFFEGYLIQPMGMFVAKLLTRGVDEEGRTMCSLLVTTSALTDPPCKAAPTCLFINTFSVKEHTSFDSTRFEMAESPIRAEEFICVDIKGRYIYKTENRLLMSLQACFV